MNIFRKHMQTEWLMEQRTPTWMEPIDFTADVRQARELTFDYETILSVMMKLGSEVKLIKGHPDAVRQAKEGVINHLNRYFYRDIHDKLIDLVLEIQEGKSKYDTVESLYKIMEDLR